MAWAALTNAVRVGADLCCSMPGFVRAVPWSLCLSSCFENEAMRGKGFGPRTAKKKLLEITDYKSLLPDSSFACENRIKCILF